jgi:NADH-quinone oxidoreductase subunit L
VPASADQPLAVALAEMEDDDARHAAVAAVPDLRLQFDPEPPHSPEVGPGYHPHESPWTMTAPLVVLGLLSIVGGFLSIPFGSLQFLEHWLEPSFELSNQLTIENSFTQTMIELVIGTIVAAAGIAAGWWAWSRPKDTQPSFEPAVSGNAWYYDIGVSRFMDGPGRILFDSLAWFDRTVIDGAVNVVGAGTVQLSAVLRKGQTGFVRRYAFGLGLGSVALLGFVVAKVLVG